MTEIAVPIDKLARVYRKIKTEIDTLTQEYDNKLETLKAQQDELKFAMSAPKGVVALKRSPRTDSSGGNTRVTTSTMLKPLAMSR